MPRPTTRTEPVGDLIPLDHRERDLQIVTRAGASEGLPEDRAARARVEAARILKPQGRELHWWECWRQGRDAAIAAVEGGAGLEAARMLQPPETTGCRDCYRKGRDAAIRTIEGTRTA